MNVLWASWACFELGGLSNKFIFRPFGKMAAVEPIVDPDFMAVMSN